MARVGEHAAAPTSLGLTRTLDPDPCINMADGGYLERWRLLEGSVKERQSHGETRHHQAVRNQDQNSTTLPPNEIHFPLNVLKTATCRPQAALPQGFSAYNMTSGRSSHAHPELQVYHSIDTITRPDATSVKDA
jgi:hypothetical protein